LPWQADPPRAMLVVVIVVVVMIVVMVVAAVAEVSVVVVVPAVVVLYAAMLPVPVAGEVLLPIMVRSDPVSAFVRRPRPIALMPFVVRSYGVPIALNPDEIRPRTPGKHGHDSGRRRCANPDPDGDLRISC